MNNLAVRLALLPLLFFCLSAGAQSAKPKSRYIVVVGMLSEAKVAQGPKVTVITGAMRENELRERLAKMDTSDVKGVISFGVAGGLNPDLKVGQLIIPQSVVFNGRSWECSKELSADLRARSSRAGVSAVTGVIAGSEEMGVGTTEWRLQFQKQTGGQAVDMETHIAAEFAASRNIPFAAVRVLSDAVGDEFPPAALLPLDEKGDVQFGKVMGSVVKNPLQIGALMRVGRNFNASMDVLKTVRKGLDPLFGTQPSQAQAEVNDRNTSF